MLSNYSLEEIVSIEFFNNDDVVYDLTIEDSHSFFANNYVVHNSGGQCRTRTVAGVGVPQFTAVMDCVEAADKIGMLVCSDGGINDYADFAKALGVGADFVMAGSIFSGHNESGGDVITLNGKDYKEMYGMSSETAMKKYYGHVAKHRASEGRTSLIPLKGPVEETIQNIFGGIRSAMSYTNSRTLEEFPSNVTFIPVNNTINRKYEQLTVGI